MLTARASKGVRFELNGTRRSWGMSASCRSKPFVYPTPSFRGLNYSDDGL